MKILYNFVKDESGATTVEWVVLAAMVISVSFVILSSIGNRLIANTSDINDAIITTASSYNPIISRHATKDIVTQTVDFSPVFLNAAPAKPYIVVSYFSAAEVCENPVSQYHDFIDTPLRQCLLLSDVMEVAHSLRHFPIRTPKTMAGISCEKPLDQFYQQPETYCLSPVSVLATLPALPPAHPYIIADLVTPPGCKNTGFRYYLMSDTPQQPCSLSSDVIAPTLQTAQLVKFDFTVVPKFAAPQDCSNSSCLYFRKSDAKPLHSYFSTAPTFFAPAQCGNPPCINSHQSESPKPFSPSLPDIPISFPSETLPFIDGPDGGSQFALVSAVSD